MQTDQAPPCASCHLCHWGDTHGLPRDTATPAPTTFTWCRVWAGRSSWGWMQRLPGRKWGPDEGAEKKLWMINIITVTVTAQIGHPLLGCILAAGGSQAEERRSWNRVSFSIPGECFPCLLWRQKRVYMVGKSGPWPQELGCLQGVSDERLRKWEGI